MRHYKEFHDAESNKLTLDLNKITVYVPKGADQCVVYIDNHIHVIKIPYEELKKWIHSSAL